MTNRFNCFFSAAYNRYSTCAISFVRIRYLHLSEDFTWDNVDSGGWSIGELCSGLTCACLPTLRPLLSKYIPGLSTGTSSSNKYYRHESSHDGTSRSRGRDLENGTRRPTIPSSESKDGLYSPAGSYELDKPASGDSSSDANTTQLPIQVPGGGFRPDYPAARLETRIVATAGSDSASAMGSAPIRVRTDIVQTATPRR
jgi:hypothetical protein